MLQSVASAADETNVSEKSSQKESNTQTTQPSSDAAVVASEEEAVLSRIYDATVIGEPLAVGKDKRKVWEKVMSGRVVYLGEAEQVPVKDDRDLELEILKNLRKRCVESERPISIALEAFPLDMQEQLNQYMDGRYVYENHSLLTVIEVLVFVLNCIVVEDVCGIIRCGNRCDL